MAFDCRQVAHARGSGFFVALVPAALRPEEFDASLHEVGVEGDEVLELGGWKNMA